jgi:hypothetical protein
MSDAEEFSLKIKHARGIQEQFFLFFWVMDL